MLVDESHNTGRHTKCKRQMRYIEDNVIQYHIDDNGRSQGNT